MNLEGAVKELFYWQYGKKLNGEEGTNFHSLLYILFQKADHNNLRKLKSGFPDEAMAWEMWCRSEDPEAFFRGFGYEC